MARLPIIVLGFAQACIATFVVLYLSTSQLAAAFLAKILPTIALHYDLINPMPDGAPGSADALDYVVRLIRIPAVCIGVVTLIGEFAGITSWSFWALGAAFALVAVPAFTGFDRILFEYLALGYLGLFFAGLVAGTVYWSFAGRTAGE